MSEPVSIQTTDFTAPVWKIGNKTDLKNIISNNYDFNISTKSGSGISDLINKLTSHVGNETSLQNHVVPTRRRHIDLLNNCNIDIQTALKNTHFPLELRAENLRHASQQLGKITGDVDVEDILDVVFSQFCIGK